MLRFRSYGIFFRICVLVKSFPFLQRVFPVGKTKCCEIGTGIFFTFKTTTLGVLTSDLGFSVRFCFLWICFFFFSLKLLGFKKVKHSAEKNSATRGKL